MMQFTPLHPNGNWSPRPLFDWAENRGLGWRVRQGFEIKGFHDEYYFIGAYYEE